MKLDCQLKVWLIILGLTSLGTFNYIYILFAIVLVPTFIFNIFTFIMFKKKYNLTLFKFTSIIVNLPILPIFISQIFVYSFLLYKGSLDLIDFTHVLVLCISTILVSYSSYLIYKVITIKPEIYTT